MKIVVGLHRALDGGTRRLGRVQHGMLHQLAVFSWFTKESHGKAMQN